ncbi:MAG: hypothetical protein CMN30_01320 [Sandaracinus sp.]|nr:hypothetical protein [Sandaracinus sp.]|tara:strand:- start:152 stop:1696 length:1545 start_codon:yes stop_codon:yes gene_type:complete
MDWLKRSTLLAAALAASIVPLGCGDDDGSASGETEASDAADGAPSVEDLERVSEAAASEETRRARAEALDREFPLHGLVDRPSVQIHESPDPESLTIGWLRWGERIRLKREKETTATCNSGWHQVAPRGWACAGEGIVVGEEPPSGPEGEEPVPPADREATMPYAYYLVKDRMVPQYHQLPSRDQQRSALAFSERYLEMLDADQDRRAERLLAGELGPGEPRVHAAIARFLNRNFYVAATDVQVRSRRRFVRTTGGGYVKEAQLEERSGSDFHGVDLAPEGEEGLHLPLPFVIRTVRPLIHTERADGSHRFNNDEESEVIERHTIPESWVERVRMGDHFYHRFESDAWDGPRYARDWFLTLAEAIEPPFEVEDDEPWIHVDLGAQTLVIYRGATPVYATLVSSGLSEHATPTGTFSIQKKMVTDTMANLGPDAGDDSYRIQDVPWTQYFEGSFALHTAFWHNRFGLQRSHGCVNLAPADAHRVFQETWPVVPEGWHGVNTQRTGFRASRVHVTD